MRLIQTERATWAEAAWTRIDKPGAKPLIGYCVRQKPVINAPGVARECNDPVYAGEGYADTDGAPFKAYYCPACAGELLAHAV